MLKKMITLFFTFLKHLKFLKSCVCRPILAFGRGTFQALGKNKSCAAHAGCVSRKCLLARMHMDSLIEHTINSASINIA